MVLQRRLEYGFNGYQVPLTPRAPRSARKRVSSWKKNEDHNQMCAFDLLATVAGKLLLEVDDSVSKINHVQTKTVNESGIKTETDSLKPNVCDQGSCNKTFFVSEIIKAPITDTCSGPASGITVSDCKIEDIIHKEMKTELPKNGKLPVVNNVDCNLNLVIRDDDETSYEGTRPDTLNNKTFRAPPSRMDDRRIRRLPAYKQWKISKNTDVYRNKINCYKYQRPLRDYPFKKRRLYQLDHPSNSDNKSGFTEDGSGLDAASQDSHVKLKIKSFRVPEFFVEIPETATVSSLKRTVMEAVTAIFSGELHVGVMLQGKRIRDDNKTLSQTGICHDNKLDALGFTLEPNELQLSPFLCPGNQSFTRDSPRQTESNEVVIKQAADSSMVNSRNINESDHDMSVDDRSVDSRALVTVPANNTGELAVVPVRKSKGAEVAQHRIRRPFSVSEVEALVEAVEKLGTGRWRDVKLRAFDDAKHRTYVDLKDKWKTLVHTARISPQQRRGEPVPQELLDRVLIAHGYWSNHQAKNQFQLTHQLELETQTCRLL